MKESNHVNLWLWECNKASYQYIKCNQRFNCIFIELNLVLIGDGNGLAILHESSRRDVALIFHQRGRSCPYASSMISLTCQQ